MNQSAHPRLALLPLLLALLLAACSGGGSGEPPLAGAAIGGPFTLIDQNGRSVSDGDFDGKYRIVYFGYSHCPDVCPTDLQQIGAGLARFEKEHPKRGASIQPIFITVDPERDTPSALKPWVAAFHPRLIGLSGTPEQIARVAKEFAIYYQKGEVQPGGGYAVNHSRMIYLMDPKGEPMALLPEDGGPDKFAAELDRWVK